MAKAFDRDGLRQFVAGGEKSPPPVFVGREGVISDIKAAALRAWTPGAAKQGEPGMTRILQGAPGSGKSSVLAELEARCAAAQAPGEPRIAVLNSADFDDMAGVYRRLAEAVNPEEADRLFEETWRGWSAGVSAQFIAGAEGRREGGSSQAAPPPTMSAFARWAAGWSRTAEAGARHWDYPLIVAIDEAQTLPAAPDSPASYFIRSIHNAAAGLPLTLVLAGLGDTADRAGEMGMTRGLVLHPIGSLTEAETGELMRGFCGRFGLDAAGRDAELEALAAPCEGWPRHLHFALQALGRQALAADGDPGGIDWDAVGREAAESRLRYYVQQQSPEMQASHLLVAAVMRDLGGGMATSGVDRLIEEHAADAPGYRLPVGTSSGEFRLRLVHQGALQRDDYGRYRCPIPSFRAFLVDAGRTPGRRLLHAASRGDGATALRALDDGADIGFRGKRGVTALHVAAGYGRAGMVRLLIGRGADPAAADDVGETPAGTALRFGKTECRPPDPGGGASHAGAGGLWAGLLNSAIQLPVTKVHAARLFIESASRATIPACAFGKARFRPRRTAQPSRRRSMNATDRVRQD